MPRKSTKNKPEPTTKHVVISAVAHETLTVLADRYGKSLGEMVALLIDNCYDYGLILPSDIKGGKHTVTTRIDLLEKQLKRTNDGNWSAIAEMKKINSKKLFVLNVENIIYIRRLTVMIHSMIFINNGICKKIG